MSAPPVAAPRKSMEPWLRDEVQFYPHQVDGIRSLIRRRSFILADQMGLGKSLQALTVFIADVVRDRGNKAIIIAPTTLKANWADEIEKHTRLRWMILGEEERKGKLRTLGPKDREVQITEFFSIEGPKVLITNYEQITPHLKALNALKFDVAIFDEAHYLKNPRAKRTKACQALKSTRSFMLTGSPMLNHVNELWSLLHRVSPSKYPNYWTFVNRHCVFGGFKNKQIVGVKNEKELKEQLETVMLRRLKKDVLDLPEVQIIQRKVRLLPEQQKLYDEVMDELQLTIPNEPEPLEIENALVKFVRAKQICATTFNFTEEDVSGKLDLAVTDIQEIVERGEKVVVFTQFRSVLTCLRMRLAAIGIDDFYELNGSVKKEARQPLVKEWGTHRGAAVLGAMLQVGGIGLNMTSAKYGMFIDKLFVPELNNQAIARLHRIGASKTQPIQIFEYLTLNTIESRVEQILTTKSGLFENIVEMGDFKRKLIEALRAKAAA